MTIGQPDAVPQGGRIISTHQFVLAGDIITDVRSRGRDAGGPEIGVRLGNALIYLTDESSAGAFLHAAQTVADHRQRLWVVHTERDLRLLREGQRIARHGQLGQSISLVRERRQTKG